MQRAVLLTLLSLLGCTLFADAASNPTDTVIELITDLQKTVIAKGEAAQKVYAEFQSFCALRGQELSLDLKKEKAEEKDLKAQIKNDKASIESNDKKEEEEAEDISTSETDLEKATKLRNKEAAEFKEEEKELKSMISMLKRAKKVLEKELSKGSTSLMQLKGVRSFADALDVMLQASLCSSEDAQRLAAFVQSHHESSDSNDEANDSNDAQPAAPAYESSSGAIIQMITELLDKAENQLSEARMKEEKAMGNFNVLKTTLGSEIQNSEDDKVTAHGRKKEAGEEKAVDEGDLGTTVDDVKAGVKSLADLRRVCMQKVQEFTAMTKSRDEEIKALAEAKRVIAEAVSGASDKVYGVDEAAALVQVRARTLNDAGSKLAKRILQKIRYLAKKDRSTELNQLVSRLTSSIRTSLQMGEDPFAKVIGMISDMIAKLEQEAADDADHNAYCEKEMGETKSKKDARSDKIDHLNTQIDQMSAQSTKLKKQVATLQEGLAEISSAQAKMDKIRGEENSEFLSEKTELEKGLQGIQMALKTLNDYYGKDEKSHQSGSTVADQIISLLETCEGDFSKTLAELAAAEQSAVTAYETQTQDNVVAKNTKTAEVDAKTKEFTALDKAVSDHQGDSNGLQNELDAVLEYMTKLEKECVIKKDSIAERIQKRKDEIAGLKDALNILETETALLQRSVRRALRGKHQSEIA